MHIYIWMFPKMVGFPNKPMGCFPTKNDHDLGCEMGGTTILGKHPLIYESSQAAGAEETIISLSWKTCIGVSPHLRLVVISQASFFQL